MKTKRLSWLLCIISGIGMGLCLLFPEFGPAVFVLAVPALVAIEKQKNKKVRFATCYAFTAGLCLASYFPAFFIQLDIEPQYEFWIDLALYVVLLVVHGGIMAFALWLGHQCKVPKGCRFLWIALCWAGVEWLLGFGPFAWPTARISLALWQYPVLFRSASLGGQLLVSALIMAVNGLLAQSILCKSPQKTRICVGIAAAVFATNCLVGVMYPAPSVATTSVAVIQTGGQAVNTKRGSVYADSFTLAGEAALSSPDLILLPEGIMPSTANTAVRVQRQWGNMAKQANADLLVGGFRDGLSTVIQYDPTGTRKAEYKKIKEVPFFENGQGKAFMFSPQMHSSVLITNCGKVGNLICYESMFSSLAQNTIKDGAEILFVSTNDSWFASSMAKQLHMAHGVYRGVETGRTVVQASIDGTSAVFDAAGNMTYSLPHESSGVLEAKVSFTPMNTPYNYLGDWWLPICFLVFILVSVVYPFKKGKK